MKLLRAFIYSFQKSNSKTIIEIKHLDFGLANNKKGSFIIDNCDKMSSGVGRACTCFYAIPPVDTSAERTADFR